MPADETLFFTFIGNRRPMRGSRLSVDNARLVQIVGRHLDVHFITDGNPDEVLAHFTGDVSEDFVTIGQSDAKHGAGQHLRHGSGQFDMLFSGHGEK